MPVSAMNLSPQSPKQSNKAKLAKVVGGAGVAALLLGTVATFEGKRNDPYYDSVNVLTVCYGETRVQMRRYSDAECEDMLAKGVTGFAENVLKRNPELKNRPYQLIAATSLAYNIGVGAYNRSTVARRFSAGDFKGGCDAFLMWANAGGKPILLKRRQQERALCYKGL